MIDEVRAWHDAARALPARLGRPLVVLVPSRSLKDHVSAVLVRELGTLAGVAVQTHYGLALQILERAGERAPSGAELVPVLVRQAAREEPVLAGALDRLDDGYGSVVGAVSDLLDAGLEPGHLEPIRELLASRGGAARERSAGVARVAATVRQALSSRGLGRMADLLSTARAALEDRPGLFAPGHLVVHGFADATGLVSDFLAALVRGRSAVVLMDRPPDPASPEQPDLGATFVDRLRETLTTATGGVGAELDPGPPKAPQIDFLRAPGSDAEVRAVARRIVEIREDGVDPEAIGIVTRTPALYAAPLRIHLERLGIPASGVAVTGPRSALGRRVAFTLDLIRVGSALPADRFVLALRAFGPGARDDLRLGVHALGVARLGDLASDRAMDRLGAHESFPLPVRRGLTSGAKDAEEGDEPRAEPADPRARRRHLSRRLLADASARAGHVVAWLAAAETPGPLAERIAGLATLLEDKLGWGRRSEAAPLLARLDHLAEALPGELSVSLAELWLVLDRGLRRMVHVPLAGRGGGVQILDVTEARARTFAHLFLLGLNRDHFPRVISEDPLLPDSVREDLQQVLPDLPVKARGHTEERFLFAELVSSSPHVTISWQILGDDGKAKAPSPLVDRMVPPDVEVPRVTTALAPEDLAAPEHPAHEWALLAGLHGTRAQARALLPTALAEARPGASAETVAAVATVRSQATAELDAFAGEDPLLGPFFGHVGPPREAADLRNATPWVTHVEAVARCPWQGFLSRVLRLERPPDALEALPDATPLLKGKVVHAALEAFVRAAIPTPPQGDPRAAPGSSVAWPEPDAARRLLVSEARRVLFEEGVGVPGFAELLAACVAPQLDAARRIDWVDGPLRVIGAEIEASIEIPAPGGARSLRFRADRLDRTDDGLSVTDYKTGAPPTVSVRDEVKARNLLKEMHAGKLLQAAAYARIEDGATGRFLFLRPDVPDDARVHAVGPGSEEAQEVFREVVGRVLAALDEGTFPPRLVKPGGDESDVCRGCDFTVACLRGDSGARRRLADWNPLPGRDARGEALRRIWILKDAG